jgi:hypothetical protein
LEIKNTVLLEDGTQHSLDDDTWAWVGDEGGLFVQLLGEEVDTQVAVLAGGRGGSNADDLARTTLQDEEIAEANVVAGNGDSVGSVGRLGGRTGRCWARGAYSNVNLLPVYMVMMIVMMVVMVTSRQAVGSTVEAVAEGVIVTWIGV